MRSTMLMLIAVLIGILVIIGMMNGCGADLIEEAASLPTEPEAVSGVEFAPVSENKTEAEEILIDELKTPEKAVNETIEETYEAPDEPEVESIEEVVEETENTEESNDSQDDSSDVVEGAGDGEGVPETEGTEPQNKHLWGVATITHYCSCSACAGQWAGGPTASGVMPTPNHTVACELPFGTRLEINGQEYVVEDRGVSGMWVDIYCNDHNEALNRGMYQAEVYIVE